MDDGNIGGGGASGSSGDRISQRFPPVCERCRNHGLQIVDKCHKRYCKNNYCNCNKCELTEKRETAVALQSAIRDMEAAEAADLASTTQS